MVPAVSTLYAFAPQSELLTITCGGARSGNSAIGSVGMETAPASTITSAHTVANTGRLMKKSTNTQRLRHYELVASWDHVQGEDLIGRRFGICLRSLRSARRRRLFRHRDAVLQKDRKSVV